MPYRIGCSGWVYKHWRGSFYPAGLRQADWFRHYAGVFDTVEINNSFYRTPTESMFQGWREQAPEGFLYAVKVNRSITQFYKLGPASYPLFEEFASRAEKLAGHLGPLLLQLPPSLGVDTDRLDGFLALPAARRIRLAVEFRRKDWFTEEVYAVLRARGAALAITDFQELPVVWEATADWSYVRFHGTSGRYFGSYGSQELDSWAERIAGLAREGYIYFNNDAETAAPRDAMALRERLSR